MSKLVNALRVFLKAHKSQNPQDAQHCDKILAYAGLLNGLAPKVQEAIKGTPLQFSVTTQDKVVLEMDQNAFPQEDREKVNYFLCKWRNGDEVSNPLVKLMKHDVEEQECFKALRELLKERQLYDWFKLGDIELTVYLHDYFEDDEDE